MTSNQYLIVFKQKKKDKEAMDKIRELKVKKGRKKKKKDSKYTYPNRVNSSKDH
jgi:hypothetical protein